jgi:acetylornithine deacetylase
MPEVVETLRRLVSCPTVSDRPVIELAAFLADRAEQQGMRVERFQVAPGKVNVVASAGPPSAQGLVLSGHMDVVPTDGQSWSSDPFVLTERDGNLHGRGTCDMKGFIAAVDTALSAMDLRKLKRELVLVWTCDEEVGCVGATHLAGTLTEMGRELPRATVIGEPTGFRICRLHPGHCTFAVVVTGQAAHSSRPALGANAIVAAGEVLRALAALADELSHQRAFEDELATPHAILTVGGIEGGTAVNIVPDRCEIRVGVRQLPGQDAADIEQLLADRLAEVDAQIAPSGCRAALRRIQVAPSLLTPKTCDHLHLLQPWAPDPRPTGAPFATDGGALAAIGLESLVFGPGSIDVAHRADEYVPAQDLFRTVDFVQDLVTRRCMSDAPAAGATAAR